MSSKLKIILIGSVFIIMLLALIFFDMSKMRYTVLLNGSNNITLEVNGYYKDKGISAYKYTFLGYKKNLKVITKSNLNTSKLGDYKITYKVRYEDNTIIKTKNIHVVDTTSPAINILDDELNVCRDRKKPILFKALDNYDGDITQKVNVKYNKKGVLLSVKDSSGNFTKKQYKVTEIDKEKPNITLNGKDTVYVTLGEEYTEYGAYAYDSCDGDISANVVITNNINLNVPGNYEVNYSVTDSYGSTSTIKRVVSVIVPSHPITYKVPKGATIYLTFDDGPGQYTEQLLDILDTYNVKATFFVTNQFPKYQYVIKKEHDRGHTIGVHTYSHLWSIYDSDEAYMNDFNLMNQIIYDQTGEYSKIFRFPGGSSNTVSCKHSKGIMTRLSSSLVSQGYQYYDWSIDCTDTHPKNTVASIISNTEASLKGNSYYIILMHDIKKNTIQALPSIIEYAKNAGYQFSNIKDNSPIVHSRIAN